MNGTQPQPSKLHPVLGRMRLIYNDVSDVLRINEELLAALEGALKIIEEVESHLPEPEVSEHKEIRNAIFNAQSWNLLNG